MVFISVSKVSVNCFERIIARCEIMSRMKKEIRETRREGVERKEKEKKMKKNRKNHISQSETTISLQNETSDSKITTASTPTRQPHNVSKQNDSELIYSI